LGRTISTERARTVDAERRRARKVEAAVLWGSMTLSGIGIVSVLTLWHLSRRAQMLRDRLGPPRDVRLPEPAGPDPLDGGPEL
jgi:hypothetical protein